VVVVDQAGGASRKRLVGRLAAYDRDNIVAAPVICRMGAG
jgi:hypothetical protein